MLEILPRVLVVSSLIKILAVLIGFFLLWLSISERWTIYRLAYGKEQLYKELRSALVVLVLDAGLIVLFRTFAGHRFAPFALDSFVLTYAWMYLVFEVWFYATHRLRRIDCCTQRRSILFMRSTTRPR